MPFFLSSISWNICMNKSITYSEVQIISWNALDVLHFFCTAFHSQQLLPQTPAWSFSPKSSCSITQSQASLIILRWFSPHPYVYLFIFPSPSLSWNSPVCPSCLKAGFFLLGSARATKTFHQMLQFALYIPLCLVQKAAGAGLGASGPHCGAGRQRRQN